MPTTPPVIDAHHHLWPRAAVADHHWRPHEDEVPEASRLRQPFEFEELIPELQRCGVDGSVVMQSVDAVEENDRLRDYVAARPELLSWVGWAPLAVPDRAAEVIEALLWSGAADGLRGVRCLVGADPMRWAVTPAAELVFRQLAAAGLVWDVVPVTPEQAERVCRVAGAVPELRVVVDHLAQPPVTGGSVARWTESVAALAEHPNVAIKLSVGVAALRGWSAWDVGVLEPFVRTALQEFGPTRSMLASNWPVVLLRASYTEAWTQVRDLAAELLSAAELGAVCGGTAQQWYGLERLGTGGVA